MEQLVVGPTIQKHLQAKTDKMVDSDQIEELARQAGMLTMLEKAVLMALQGETTLEEINRVL